MSNQTKRQILTNTIIRCKQEIQEYKSRVTNYERSLYEAEAALKRLNEEEKKKGGQAVHLPRQKLRKTDRPTKEDV